MDLTIDELMKSFNLILSEHSNYYLSARIISKAIIHITIIRHVSFNFTQITKSLHDFMKHSNITH